MKVAILVTTCFINWLTVAGQTAQSNQASTGNDIGQPSAKLVKVGKQVWMSRNLSVSTFANGDSIPEVKTDREWKRAAEEGWPAWCYYDNDSSNGRIFGKLYNWYAVNDPRGLLPRGWHVPTDDEWNELDKFLGGGGKTAQALKSPGWATGNGNNRSGLAFLPGGFRDRTGPFNGNQLHREEGIGNRGYWWSSTGNNGSYAWLRTLSSKGNGLGAASFGKGYGFSVRCIED